MRIDGEKVEALDGKALDGDHADALATARRICASAPWHAKIDSLEELEELRRETGEALSTLNDAKDQ